MQIPQVPECLDEVRGSALISEQIQEIEDLPGWNTRYSLVRVIIQGMHRLTLCIFGRIVGQLRLSIN